MGRQPATGLIFSFFLQLHHRLLLLHLVVAEAFANSDHLRLHRLHLRHRGVGLVGEREEDELDQDGDDQDGNAEISDLAIDSVERQEHRLGDETEIAPVDQQLEAIELEVGVVGVDDLHLLGAGEQPGAGGTGGAGCDRLRVEQIVGLEFLDVVGKLEGEAGTDLGRDIGEKRGGPIFVGDTEPGVGRSEGLLPSRCRCNSLPAACRRARRSALRAGCSSPASAACRGGRSARRDRASAEPALLVGDLVAERRRCICRRPRWCGGTRALRRCRRRASPDDRRRARLRLPAATAYRRSGSFARSLRLATTQPTSA